MRVRAIALDGGRPGFAPALAREVLLRAQARQQHPRGLDARQVGEQQCLARAARESPRAPAAFSAVRGAAASMLCASPDSSPSSKMPTTMQSTASVASPLVQTSNCIRSPPISGLARAPKEHERRRNI